jgi:two-component sensor histidine kinase/CHASE1-domain containing sensor protein
MRLRVYLPTLLILLLLLGATGLASWLLFSDASEKARRQFQEQASAFEGLMVDAMRSYQQVLRAGVAAMNAIPAMTREQWRLIIRDLAVDDFYPGIQGVGYVKRLRYEEIDGFVEGQRRAGRSDYRFNPEGKRDDYTAIVYLEPENWRNSRAIGYDMFSEPRRRAAMERARDSGGPALSRKVALMQETGEDVQAGTLVYMPVYADGTIPDTAEGRRAALTGYVFGAFRMGDFIPRVIDRNLPGTLQGLHIQIYDGTETTEADLMFDERMLTHDRLSRLPPLAREPLFTDRRTITVAGTDWTIVLQSKAALEGMIDRSKAWMVLLGGTVISLLIAGIVASLAYARERYAATEQRLSVEVAERKRAQEQAQLANRELIHRVKNILAIVTAIASQTARYSSTVDVFNKSFRERLTSLARVHDLLRPDPAHTPDLGSFIREILAPYCHWQGALVAQGPEIDVTQNQAVLLSLLINELATNATKYGAWSVPSGQVMVTWGEEQSSDGDELDGMYIVWQERNGPPVEAPSKSGFGTNVMKFSIERGLGGRITTSFHPSGVRHEVRLPKSSVPDTDGGQPTLAAENRNGADG